MWADYSDLYTLQTLTVLICKNKLIDLKPPNIKKIVKTVDINPFNTRCLIYINVFRTLMCLKNVQSPYHRKNYQKP